MLLFSMLFKDGVVRETVSALLVVVVVDVVLAFVVSSWNWSFCFSSLVFIVLDVSSEGLISQTLPTLAHSCKGWTRKNRYYLHFVHSLKACTSIDSRYKMPAEASVLREVSCSASSMKRSPPGGGGTSSSSESKSSRRSVSDPCQGQVDQLLLGPRPRWRAHPERCSPSLLWCSMEDTPLSSANISTKSWADLKQVQNITIHHLGRERRDVKQHRAGGKRTRGRSDDVMSVSGTEFDGTLKTLQFPSRVLRNIVRAVPYW